MSGLGRLVLLGNVVGYCVVSGGLAESRTLVQLSNPPSAGIVATGDQPPPPSLETETTLPSALQGMRQQFQQPSTGQGSATAQCDHKTNKMIKVAQGWVATFTACPSGPKNPDPVVEDLRVTLPNATNTFIYTEVSRRPKPIRDRLFRTYPGGLPTMFFGWLASRSLPLRAPKISLHKDREAAGNVITEMRVRTTLDYLLALNQQNRPAEFRLQVNAFLDTL